MTEAGSAELKQEALGNLLRASAPLVIAYSGGVDSAYLLAVGAKTLGHDCLAVIADSPSLPRQALQDALRLARQLPANVEVLTTEEMQNPDYTSNPINRCYFCKAELFTRLDALARDRGYRAVAYGENADDASQVRPGRRAAAEFKVLAPLREVGLTKSEIRILSRALHLPNADAPAQPCLSSRIPHGTPVTAEALQMIERAEAVVRSFGFRVFRVRHHAKECGVGARLEILPNEMPKLANVRAALVSGVQAVGYGEVVVAPRGYAASSA
ncbi:MAG: ATP-dependent sacrificial sulfur transferase LarE [Verrucomicrobiota bacterium]|nr:ATP-dependent sacrificial sulfur transferase LarE [Verrucomicrobiota bacterium]